MHPLAMRNRAHGGLIRGEAARPGSVILAVDPDPHVRTLLEHFVAALGHEIQFAEDGLDGWEKVQRLHPDLVITEILTPRLDGLRLCARIRGHGELAERTRVLVCSLLVAEDRARQAGADGFLKKPLSRRRLVETLDAVLARAGEAAEEAE